MIDAVIPAMYSALLVFGAFLFSVSFLALIICVIVILISTNYWAFIYRPASLAHSRRKRELKTVAADGGWTSIKFNATSSKANSSEKPRYQSEAISAYCWRVFHMVKCSLQYGITVLSYRGKREKKHFAAQSVWCGMKRPLLLFRTFEDFRTKSTPSSTSAPSPAYPLPVPLHKSFAPPTPSFSSPFYTTLSPHTLSQSLLPTKSHGDFYTRQARSLGLNGAPMCIRNMLIISTDTVLQEREKEKERKREKERSRKQREKERRLEERDRERGKGGVTNGGGRGEEMSLGVRGRGGLHHTRQLSSTRSLGDELVVTRTGQADSSRRLVAPSIMFYSRQALTLMRSR